MNMVSHTVTLKSEQHFGSRLPPADFGAIMRVLPAAVRQSIRMAFAGRSTSPGRRHHWLDAASDIRFLGHSGDDDTILHFEAPPFGEAARTLYQQQEFWSTRPDASDTGFDSLGDVICDVSAGNQDSERFDSPLLRRIARFEKGLDGAFQEMTITGHRHGPSDPVILSKTVIETARKFVTSTPTPQRVRIVGSLDMIRASTQSFALKLDDGQEMRGVLVNGDIDRLAELFHHRVLVLGKSMFRPSGKVLRVDAEHVEPAGEESAIWSKMPMPGRGRLEVSELRQPQGPRSGIAAVIGKWPGDETDEQIKEALEEMS